MAAYRILEYHDGTYTIQKKSRLLIWKNVLENVRSWKRAKRVMDGLIASEYTPKGVKEIHGPYNEMQSSPTGY